MSNLVPEKKSLDLQKAVVISHRPYRSEEDAQRAGVLEKKIKGRKKLTGRLLFPATKLEDFDVAVIVLGALAFSLLLGILTGTVLVGVTTGAFIFLWLTGILGLAFRPYTRQTSTMEEELEALKPHALPPTVEAYETYLQLEPTYRNHSESLMEEVFSLDGLLQEHPHSTDGQEAYEKLLLALTDAMARDQIYANQEQEFSAQALAAAAAVQAEEESRLEAEALELAATEREVLARVDNAAIASRLDLDRIAILTESQKED